jgi:hypothetical protein
MYHFLLNYEISNLQNLFEGSYDKLEELERNFLHHRNQEEISR